MAMELIIKTNLEKEIPKSIDFNFESLKTELSDRLKYYNALVVTEESIKDAKADRARLNKLREAIEDKRKEVKSAVLEPYNDFERKCKELVAMIDEPIRKIDEQTEVFKKMEQEKKTAQIAEIYNSHIGDMAQLLGLDKIWNPRWLNVTYSIKDIEKEISEKITRTATDLKVIDSSIEDEFKDAIKVTYLRTLDLSKSLEEYRLMKAQAKAIREREERERKEAERKLIESLNRPLLESQEEPTPAPVQEAQVESPKMYRLVFECMLTKEQAWALDKWLRENGIKFRRVK